jgi:hypothetical protein
VTQSDDHARPPESSPDDAELLARLGALFGPIEQPPADAVELAKLSFGLRTADAELAALVADSEVDSGLAVRFGDTGDQPRLFTFETGDPAGEGAGGDSAVEVEISGVGRGSRMVGQLHPPGPARIELRQPGGAEPRSVDADDQGRFLIEGLDPAPFSLLCHRPGQRPIRTAWTSPS